MKVILYYILFFGLIISNYSYNTNKEYKLSDGTIKIVGDSIALFFPFDKKYDEITLKYNIINDTIHFNSIYQKNILNEFFYFKVKNTTKEDSVIFIFSPNKEHSDALAMIKIYDDQNKFLKSYSYLFDSNKKCHLPSNASFISLSLYGNESKLHKIDKLVNFDTIITTFDYLNERDYSKYIFIKDFKLHKNKSKNNSRLKVIE